MALPSLNGSRFWLGDAGKLSPAELAAWRDFPEALQALFPEVVRASWENGEDLAGEIYLAAASRKTKADTGMVYTPQGIVEAMVDWLKPYAPVRIVDMGCGSGRFAAQAAKTFPDAEVIGVDLDPVACLLTRARLASMGHDKARVLCGDYRKLVLPPVEGVTAFLGNPPYVRHHAMNRESKAWGQELAQRLGMKLSGLAGLHVHFLLATRLLARPGDVGCVITGSEWMQVGYGKPVRELLAGDLGLQELHLLDPKAQAFDGVLTTAAVFGFVVGSQAPKVRVILHHSAKTLGRPESEPQLVDRQKLRGTPWGFLLPSPATLDRSTASLRLKAIARVHRGVATGANRFFVMTAEQAEDRGLTPWTRPVLTDAREVLEAGGVVRATERTQRILCPPKDVDLADPANAPLAAYLAWGEKTGVDQGYLCRHRKPWWYLGPMQAPPIVVTYMARQAPAFALNPEGLKILNVFHGIYPTRDLAPEALERLAAYLQGHRKTFQGHGRVYQGGLEKFEPREIEQLPIPENLLEPGG